MKIKVNFSAVVFFIAYVKTIIHAGICTKRCITMKHSNVETNGTTKNSTEFNQILPFRFIRQQIHRIGSRNE